MKNKKFTAYSMFAAMLMFLLYSCADEQRAADESTGGQSTITSQSMFATSPACPYGGISVYCGIDENSNGKLDSEEADTIEEVCNGAPGSAGGTALVDPAILPSGDSNCPYGGAKIDSGMDTQTATLYWMPTR